MRPARTAASTSARSLRHQRFGVELHVVEHLAHRVALDDRVEHDVAVVVEADVHGVGVAEQVVQVAEDFLVGADQEHAEVVRLAVEACAAAASS